MGEIRIAVWMDDRCFGWLAQDENAVNGLVPSTDSLQLPPLSVTPIGYCGAILSTQTVNATKRCFSAPGASVVPSSGVDQIMVREANVQKIVGKSS